MHCLAPAGTDFSEIEVGLHRSSDNASSPGVVAYRHQHYLPLAYLSQFALPPDREPRKRTTWRVADDFGREVPILGQCQENFFYSKSRAAFCETYFGKIEGIYGSLMKRLGRGETLTAHELFLLFLCAVDFFARGSKFRAQSEREEFELYLHRVAIFKRELINANLTNASEEAQRAYLLNNWFFRIVIFPENAALLTSDSPSIWLGASRSRNELRGVLMPITPLMCLVGANQRSYRIVSTAARPEDAGVINNNVIENCVNAVFCRDPVSAKEISIIQGQLAKRTVLQPRADAWAFELIDYDQNPNLSFLANA